MQLAKVKYQVATYSGETYVNCNENTENEHIIAKARERVRRDSGGSLPFGYQHFEVVSRENC